MLCYLGNAAVDAFTQVVRSFQVTHATGKAEVEAAIQMAKSCAKKTTKIVGDRGYDQQPFLRGIRELGMVPHPRPKSKNSQLEAHIACSDSHGQSMKKRYLVEGVFGWTKAVGGMRQTKLRSLAKVHMDFGLSLVAKNLLTIAKRGTCQA